MSGITIVERRITKLPSVGAEGTIPGGLAERFPPPVRKPAEPFAAHPPMRKEVLASALVVQYVDHTSLEAIPLRPVVATKGDKDVVRNGERVGETIGDPKIGGSVATP